MTTLITEPMTEPTTKECNECKGVFEINADNFYYYGNKPILSKCKGCKRKYNSEYCKKTLDYKVIYQKRKEYLKNLAKKWNLVKVECEACKNTYCKTYINHHNKSAKHLNNVQSLSTGDEGTAI